MALLASDYLQSKYLNAGDLKGPTTVRIKFVLPEVLGQEKKAKPVAYFTNLEKGLPLNKTNLRVLQSAYGDDMADWKGKTAVVFPTMTDLRGAMVAALRIRMPPPKENSSAANGPTPSKPGFDLLKPTTTAAALDTFAATKPTPTSTSPEPDPDLDDELPW